MEEATSSREWPDAVRWTQVAAVASRGLLLLALVAQVLVAWKFWNLTWDDSAITLGFSRTLAMTGRIAPTPGSPVVEGYSSTLWMLLMAGAAKLIVTPGGLLAFAKVSTLVLNLANLALIRRWIMSWSSELLANLVAGSVGCERMFYETINGMETPLILLLVLVMLLLFSREGFKGRLGYLVVGSLFVLVRWEAAWLLIPFLLMERGRRALVPAGVWGFVFLVSNGARWFYFGSILPNTILAKSGPPYSDPMSLHELTVRLGEPLSMLSTCRLTIAIGLVPWLAGWLVTGRRLPVNGGWRALAQTWQLQFAVLFTLSSLVLTWVIGPNTGPPFRSFYCGWPFLFCLLLMPVALAPRAWLLAAASLAVCLTVLKRTGRAIHDLRQADAPLYDARTTVDTVRRMARVLADVRAATHYGTVVYASPDMGGVMLFGENVQVVDLGLLCDPVLSRARYGAIGSYVLGQRRPDVIEVHDAWTTFTNFKSYPQFRQGYQMVLVDGERVFLRRELVARIDPSRLRVVALPSTGTLHTALLDQDDEAGAEADVSLNQVFERYLVLDGGLRPVQVSAGKRE